MVQLFEFLKGKIDQWKAKDLNLATFNDYLFRLTELAINMYEWSGLPEEVDERYLELTLHTCGVALFFKDDVLATGVKGSKGYAIAKTACAGNLDIYSTPNNRQAYAVTGYNHMFDQSNSVLIFNNRLRTPGVLTLELYAHRLADLQRSIDVNVKAQKTPMLIQCTDKQRATLKNLYAQYDGNEPVIFSLKGLDDKPIESIKTDAPYVSDRLHQLKRQTWNEAVTFIGIESANTEKAERLITDEVTSNLGTAEAQRYVKLNERRVASKKINKMFGLKIEVDFRSNNTVLDTSLEGNGAPGLSIDAATYRRAMSPSGDVKALGEQGRAE